MRGDILRHRAIVLIVLAAGLLALALVAPSAAQEWTKYVSFEDRFIVNFPGGPEIEEMTYRSEYGAMLPARIYHVDDGIGRYSVTVVDYTDIEQRLRERPDQTFRGDDMTGDVLGSVAFAATNMRRRGGEITYDAWAAIDRIAGHQLQITNADQSRTFAGLYLHDSRLYIVEAAVPEGWPPPGHFQQSIGILDAEGKRVRYELDVDGNRTRVQTSYEWAGDYEDDLEASPN
jgi:hypothetical protein